MSRIWPECMYTDKVERLRCHLGIRPAGTDFFGNVQEKLLKNVIDGDRQKVAEAISKSNLIHLAEQEASLSLSFSMKETGTETPHTLQTIKTRESDHHHVVIGIKRKQPQ